MVYLRIGQALIDSHISEDNVRPVDDTCCEATITQ